MPTLKRRTQPWRVNSLGTYLDFFKNFISLSYQLWDSLNPSRKSQFLRVYYTSGEDSVYLLGDFG